MDFPVNVFHMDFYKELSNFNSFSTGMQWAKPILGFISSKEDDYFMKASIFLSSSKFILGSHNVGVSYCLFYLDC